MDVTLQGKQELYAPYAENEGYDRTDLRLPGQQMELAKNLARRTNTPLVAILVHGGPVDVSWLQASPRIGAILTAWYPGQVGDLRCWTVRVGVRGREICGCCGHGAGLAEHAGKCTGKT